MAKPDRHRTISGRSPTRRGRRSRGATKPEASRVRRLTLSEARSLLDANHGFVAFDLEHCGNPPQRIVEVGGIRLDRGSTGLVAGATFQAVIQTPPRQLSPYARRKTNLRNADLRNGSPRHETLAAFRRFLSDSVPILHAAADDIRTLNLNLSRHAIEPLPARAADVQQWAKVHFGCKKLRLADLATAFGARAPTHRALADAIATLEIFIAMIGRSDEASPTC